MATEKISLNFKVRPEIKNLLKQLVILKSVVENEPSSQHAVLEEALVVLMKKYNAEYKTKEV